MTSTRSVSRFRVTAVLVALVVAAVTVVAARPAKAAGTSLPDGFGGIAVDDTHGHVFVSSPIANAVTILDFSGNVVGTISDLAGAGSMLVDGSTLYVVLGNRGTVDAYNTQTFQRVGRYGEGTLVKPGPLAMAGGKLWTSTGECSHWGTKLASIDLTPAHSVQVHDVPTGLGYCIGLADAPHATNQLVAWNLGLSPASTFRLDVSGGTPVLAVELRHENLANLQQLAVTPDGASFLAASGAPYEIDEFRMSDQQPNGIVYPTGPYPVSVAVTGARGGLVAAGRATADPHVDVFQLGDPSQRVASYGLAPTNLLSRGLAFSGDGRFIFAVVTNDVYNTSAQFNVIDLMPPPPTTTTTQPVPPGSGVDTDGAGTWTDPTGDVTDLDSGAPLNDPRGDLVSAGVGFEDGRIVFTMRALQPTSPLTDPNWAKGSSSAAWLLDTDFDDVADRLAILVSADGSLYGGITDVNDPPNLLCEATPSAAGGTLSLSVDPGCIGDSFTWAAMLIYDLGGPGADGPYTVDYGPDGPPDNGITTAGVGDRGYWLLSAAGDVYAFGEAGHYGNQPTDSVDIEPTPAGGGYWILGADGHVYAKGSALPLGNAPLPPGERAVSLSTTPTGQGYWVFTDRGRVFNFGDAPYRGDVGGVRLNGPVLGSVATPSGQGYWMVASDGGIFSFGDAVFAGSMGGRRLNQPVMSMAPDPDGHGYWLVASDGGIFAFDAPFYGSTGGIRLNQPISGMVPGKAGYLMVARDGGTFAFGDVAFHGSLGGHPPAQPIVAVALTPASMKP